MNYKEMSDHEINMAVTYIVHNLHGWSVNKNNNAFYNCGIDGSGHYMVNCIDYCNNPNDAWPVIVENNISLLSVSDYALDRKLKKFKLNFTGKYIASGFPVMSDGFNGDELQVMCENPLRAAMICFLKMKES